MSTPRPPRKRPSFPKMVGRALRRRCPWCGGKKAWFLGWFRKAERCQTCGLQWSRGQDGWELGAMTVAVLITGGSVVVLLVVGIIASYPDIAVVPMAVGGAALAVLVPLITYPFTHTLFSAFDLAVHEMTPEETEAAQEYIAELKGPGSTSRGATTS